MRVPIENLDDFTNYPSKRRSPEPPSVQRVRFTGKVETLEPLAYWEGPAKRIRDTADLYWLSWFHRSLVVSGAAVLIAVILASGIYFEIFGPPAGPVSPNDVAIHFESEELPMLDEGPLTSDLFATPSSSSESDGSVVARPTLRRKYVRSQLIRAAVRPRKAVRRPQLIISEFLPTTLVIYAQNGEVKTRLETHVVPSYKKSRRLPIS